MHGTTEDFYRVARSLHAGDDAISFEKTAVMSEVMSENLGGNFTTQRTGTLFAYWYNAGLLAFGSVATCAR